MFRDAECHGAAVFEPKDLVAQRFDVGDGMGDENDGDAAVAQLVDAAHAAMTEGGVSDRESFVDQKDLGVDTDGDREGQPHHHTAGIRFHRSIDEFADAGKLFNGGIAAVDLALRKSEDGGVEIDVVPAGEFGIETRPQLEEGGDASIDGDGSGRRLENAGHELESGAFAGAVLADNAEDLAAPDGEAEIADRMEIAMERAAAAGE